MRVVSYMFYFIAFLSIANVCKSNQDIYSEQLPHFLNDFVKYQDAGTEVIFISCCESENLFKVLKEAAFLIGYNRCNDAHIFGHTSEHNILFVADLRCPSTKKHIEKVINPKYIAHPFRWIMINKDLTSVPNIRALPDSNIYLVAPKDFGTNFEINQFYKTEKNSSVIFETYGNWSTSAGLTASQQDKILSRRRRDLRRKVLTASIVIMNNDTLNHLEDYRNTHIDAPTKVNFQITKNLIDSVNGTMVIVIVDTWGYPDPKTGKWNGMIGNILAKKADIGGTVLFMTANRIPILEFLSMTTATRTQFVFREPPLSYVSNIYSLPFTRLVWISAVAIVSLAVIVILFTIKFEIKSIREEGVQQKGLRLSDFILIGISSACQMGTFMHPKLMSARISTIFLLIAVLFLYISYTANIVALLQSTTKSIQTLSDLLKSQLAVGVEDVPYNRFYFPDATEPVRKKLYRKKVIVKGVPQYMNVSEGMSKLRKGLFAFHVELGVGYKIMEETFYEHEKCNIMSIPFIQVTTPWYSIAKYSAYKEMLKVNLFKIREHGLQTREYDRIYTKKPVCASTGQSFGSVRLTDCYAAVVILSIGYGLAIFAFFFERMLKDYKICLI